MPAPQNHQHRSRRADGSERFQFTSGSLCLIYPIYLPPAALALQKKSKKVGAQSTNRSLQQAGSRATISAGSMPCALTIACPVARFFKRDYSNSGTPPTECFCRAIVGSSPRHSRTRLLHSQNSSKTFPLQRTPFASEETPHPRSPWLIHPLSIRRRCCSHFKKRRSLAHAFHHPNFAAILRIIRE